MGRLFTILPESFFKHPRFVRDFPGVTPYRSLWGSHLSPEGPYGITPETLAEFERGDILVMDVPGRLGADMNEELRNFKYLRARGVTMVSMATSLAVPPLAKTNEEREASRMLDVTVEFSWNVSAAFTHYSRHNHPSDVWERFVAPLLKD